MTTVIANQDCLANPNVLSGVQASGTSMLRDTAGYSQTIAVTTGQKAKSLSKLGAASLRSAATKLHNHYQRDKEHFASSNQLFGAHLPQASSNLTLQISIPDFEGVLALPLIDVSPNMESGTISLRAAIDADSTFVVTLSGELSKKEDSFEIIHVGQSIVTTTKLARTDFMLASIRAMLTLSKQVSLQIPEIQLDLKLSFETNLLDNSKMLRRRQIAFRIMVIERATGYEFELPSDISGEEVETIALIYHAIMESSFDWPVDTLTVFVPAKEEWLNRLTFVNQFTAFTLGPDPISKSLFGKQISLGNGTVTVLDKIIEDFDKIQQELARNDGHSVAVVIRSLTGQGRYELSGAPRLPKKPWNETIQRLIDLETKLDVALTMRYHALAASTLEGLTDEEKIAITTRPTLDENAFSLES